jgi:general secretion pathway protein D
VVIGGLIRNAVRRGTTRIPFLGDIPILGVLFRTENRTVERRNLLLFMTPYVIRDQSDLRRIFERKMRERQEFLDRYFVFSESQDFHPLVDYTRTNGMIEEIRQAIRELRVQAEIESHAIPRRPPPHSISQPIELPAELRGGGAGGGGAGGGGAQAPPPGDVNTLREGPRLAPVGLPQVMPILPQTGPAPAPP